MMEMVGMMDILVAVGVVLVLVGIGVGWSWVREWAKGNEYERFVDTVDAAVKWAEQTMKSAEGREKYAQVMAQIQAAFPRLDVSFIAMFVERCVLEMKREKGG